MQRRPGVVVAVDFQVVDDVEHGMDPEGVVGRADRVLEVHVQLVHAGRVVDVDHDLVGVSAGLGPDLPAALGVDPLQ